VFGGSGISVPLPQICSPPEYHSLCACCLGARGHEKKRPAGSLGKSNVATGGGTWDVHYDGYVVSLLRTTNTSSAAVDIEEILDWIITDKRSFNDSWTLYQVQFGPEIVADSGVQSFVIDGFSVSSS
jgi:hypothetical protein